MSDDQADKYADAQRKYADRRVVDHYRVECVGPGQFRRCARRRGGDDDPAVLTTDELIEDFAALVRSAQWSYRAIYTPCATCGAPHGQYRRECQECGA